MKIPKLTLLFGLLFLSAFRIPHSALAADVLVRARDSGLTAKGARTVTLTPASAQRIGDNALIVRETLTGKTDLLGELTFTNVLFGSYNLSISGSPSTTFPIYVPNSNGVWLAHDLVAPLLTGTNDVAGYTRAQIDTKLAALPSGTNSTINTNDPIAFKDDLSVDGTLTAQNVALGDVSAMTITIAEPIAVRAGGTGTSNLPSGRVLVGDGTNPVSTVEGFTGTISNLVTLDEMAAAIADVVVEAGSVTPSAVTGIVNAAVSAFGATNEPRSALGSFTVRSTNADTATLTVGYGGGRWQWVYDPTLTRSYLTNGSSRGFEFDGGYGRSIAAQDDIDDAIAPLANTNTPTLFNPRLRWGYAPLGGPSQFSFETNALGEMQLTFEDDFGDRYTNLIAKVDGTLVAGNGDRFAGMSDVTSAANTARLNAGTAATNHAGIILQSATNHAANAANSVSNWVNSVSNRFNGFTVNLTNADAGILQSATGYTRTAVSLLPVSTNAVSNIVSTALASGSLDGATFVGTVTASSFSGNGSELSGLPTIADVAAKQTGSITLSNAVGTGIITNSSQVFLSRITADAIGLGAFTNIICGRIPIMATNGVTYYITISTNAL